MNLHKKIYSNILIGAVFIAYSSTPFADIIVTCLRSQSATQCDFSGQGNDLTAKISSILTQYQNNLIINILPGSYLLTPLAINNHNNITLHITGGATLVAPPYRDPSWNHQTELITVSNATNFTLMGDNPDQNNIVSVINGNGETWRTVPNISPDILDISSVTGIKISGIQMLSAPQYSILINNSDQLAISSTNVTVCTTADLCANAIYTDGIHLNNVQNVTISNVYLATGDEGIAIGANRPIKNIQVDHVSFWYGHGFDLGSVVDGPLSGVTASNLDFHYSQNGLRIRTICGQKDCSDTKGGSISNVNYSNITMDHITNYPIIYDFHTGTSGSVSDVQVTNITYNNVTSTASATIAYARLLCRKPNICTNLNFNNVNLDTRSECQGVDGGSYNKIVSCPFTK